MPELDGGNDDEGRMGDEDNVGDVPLKPHLITGLDPDSPGGFTGAAISSAVVMLEELAAVDGWDRPSTLWQVDMPPAADVAGALIGDDTFAIALAFRPLQEFHSHPTEVLTGLTISGEACVGAALVTEAWSFPLDAEGKVDQKRSAGYSRPSEHPERVEMRIAILVLSDGSSAAATRIRGSDVVVHPSDDVHTFDGAVVRHLRRSLGLPSVATGPAVTFEQMQRRLLSYSITDIVIKLVERFLPGGGGGVDTINAAELAQIDGHLVSGVPVLLRAARQNIAMCGFHLDDWDSVYRFVLDNDVPAFIADASTLPWYDLPMWVDWLDDQLPGEELCWLTIDSNASMFPMFLDELRRDYERSFDA